MRFGSDIELIWELNAGDIAAPKIPNPDERDRFRSETMFLPWENQAQGDLFEVFFRACTKGGAYKDAPTPLRISKEFREELRDAYLQNPFRNPP